LIIGIEGLLERLRETNEFGEDLGRVINKNKYPHTNNGGIF